MNEKIRLAVDVGGTFTDVVKLIPSTGEIIYDKVPTTPSSPTEGVLGSFERANAPMADIETFNHGTTLGLNALLTRTGARIAVIGTKGFRDIYLLGRTDRRAMYSIKYRKPQPLLERSDTFEVIERSTFEGEVHQPLDKEDARRVAQFIAREGYEAVAVAFLHAYENPQHEIEMREILREVAPDVEVTLSHELSREYREYERTSTAVLDAYIKPIVRSYLTKLQGEMETKGFNGRFLMTRSGGGAMTALMSREQPVNLILSGPAGGVIGATVFSKLIGQPNLITIDMGGTSLDASLVVDGESVLYQGAEFEGLPINTPSLYIHTIGAGGGSIAWLDDAGALQVGPKSAGAVPGPASYGDGGTQPTFTDAALVLGYLGSETPLGGTLTLDLDLARKALEPIAGELGMTIETLARGIVRISATKIMGAVRAITVELGRDPKDFSLLSFGGGGGLVGLDVAEELNIPSVIIPPGQGAFSALGMLMADVQHDLSRTVLRPIQGMETAELEALFVEMENEARTLLESEGFDSNAQELIRTIDVRYQGQEHTVNLPYPNGGDIPAALNQLFAHLHQQKYGHSMDDPTEMNALRLKAVGVVKKPDLPKLPKRLTGGPTPNGQRSVYLSQERTAIYSLYVREELLAGDAIEGPAVIAEHTATTVVHDGWLLSVGEYGELTIKKSEVK